MDALASGGRTANQGMSVASSMMSGVLNSMNQQSQLAFNMDKLLKQEEARKAEQELKSQQMLQNAFQFTATMAFKDKQLAAQEAQNKIANEIAKRRTDLMDLNAQTSIGNLGIRAAEYQLKSDAAKQTAKLQNAALNALGGIGSTENASGSQEDLPNIVPAPQNAISIDQSVPDTLDFRSEYVQNIIPTDINTAPVQQLPEETSGTTALTAGGVPQSLTAASNKLANAEKTALLFDIAGFKGGKNLTGPAKREYDLQLKRYETAMSKEKTPQEMRIAALKEIPEKDELGMTIPQSQRIAMADQLVAWMNGKQSGNTAVQAQAGSQLAQTTMDRMLNTFVNATSNPAVANEMSNDSKKWTKISSMATNILSQPSFKKAYDAVQSKSIMNYLVSGMTSKNDTVRENTLKSINNSNLPMSERVKLTKEVNNKYFSDDVAPNIRYSDKSGDLEVDSSVVDGTSQPEKHSKDTIQWINNQLTADNLNQFRHTALGGSKIADWMETAVSIFPGINSTGELNAQIEKRAKQYDADALRTFKIAPHATAAWSIDKVGDMAIKDPTQPFYFGSGIFGYSSYPDRKDQTIETFDPMTKTKGEMTIANMVIPDVVGNMNTEDYIKRELRKTGECTKNQLYKCDIQSGDYAKYLNKFINENKKNIEKYDYKYNYNVISATNAIDTARRKRGYIVDGKYELDPEVPITFTVFDMNDGKKKQVTMPFKSAAATLTFMLSSTAIPQ